MGSPETALKTESSRLEVRSQKFRRKLALGKSILWESWSFPSSHFLIADVGLVLHLLCSWLAWQTKEQVRLPQEALALLLSWLLMQALSRNALEMGFPSAIPKRAYAAAGNLSHTKGKTGSQIPLEACVLPIRATSSNADYKYQSHCMCARKSCIPWLGVEVPQPRCSCVWYHQELSVDMVKCHLLSASHTWPKKKKKKERAREKERAYEPLCMASGSSTKMNCCFSNRETISRPLFSCTTFQVWVQKQFPPKKASN